MPETAETPAVDWSAIIRGWRHAHGGPLGSAVIRSTPEDFRVTEWLDFEPDGEGDHLWLWVRKRGANTAWVADRLADFANLSRRDVGVSGMKDRHAVTEQWFSLPAHGALPDMNSAGIEGVEVLRAVRHGRKLRRGTHAANHFDLVLRDVTAPQAALEERLATIRDVGVPNYFGPQRFGREAANLDRAHAWLVEGQRAPRRHARSMPLSAARSLLFNDFLSSRVGSQNWNRPAEDGWMMLDGTNSVFRYAAEDAAIQSRCDVGDLHPAGPLWGRGGGYAPPQDEILGAFAEALEQHAELGYRSLRLMPQDLTWDCRGDNCLRLQFGLPAGGFATTLLRELTDVQEA